MARLPVPGADDGTWGEVLNDFLSVDHNTDGTIKASGTIANKADDTDVVHVSGNETIAGTKTFSSSPIVPTPTTNMQAATKQYVDTTASAGTPDADATTKGKLQLAGDLGGTAALPTVPELANKQPIDADLTAIAGLSPSNDDVIQRKAGAWTNRTPAQLKTDLALVKGDVGLGNVDNTSDANKPVSTATSTALSGKTDKSTLTTKGDLYVATAASTPARLGVGSDNQVLTADASQSTGVKWASVSIGAVTGIVYLNDHATTSTAGTGLIAAIAALPSGGGKVIVPAGTWTLDAAVTFSKTNVTIEGVGNASNFRFDGTAIATAFGMADTTQRAVFLRNFRITQTSASNAGLAIDMSYMARGLIENVYIEGSSGSTNAPVGGILFSQGGVNGTYYNLVEHCRIQAGGAGSYCIKFENVANSNTVHDCRLLGAATATGVIVDSHAICLNRVDVETGLLVGIDILAAGNDCSIISPYLEANQTNLRIASGVESTTVVGGVIIDATTANITDNGSRGFSMINTRLQYESHTYRTNNGGLAPKRWIAPAIDGLGQTSAAFGNAIGNPAVWSTIAIDIHDSVYTDGMLYTVGTTSNGNVTGALWGPATTEDSGASLTLVASTASTAQGTASTPQFLAWSSAVLLRPGRYYIGLMADNTTGTYMGFGTVTDTLGRTGYFNNSGGYTTPQNPSAAGWTANGNRIPMYRLRCTPATNL